MVNDFFSTKEILPKLWLQYIQKYWEKRIPAGYPESSSEFSFIYTEEEKDAIEEMEKNLDTEESIISPEVVPEHGAVWAYIGTYNVTGTAGERTLLCPQQLPETAIGAACYHYDDETNEWNLIEDTEVVDGYVWGTLESFSPICTVTFRRDSYVDDSNSQFNGPVYVCNGVPTKVYKEDDKIIAESLYGKKTEIDSTYYVVGGTYDGSSVDSTNLYVEGVELKKVVGGSYYFGDKEHSFKNHINNIKLVLKDVTTTSAITGAGVWCSADLVEITAENVTSNGLGCEESFCNKFYSNATLEDSAKRLGSNQYVKKSIIKVKNSTIEVLYAAGDNGFSYTQDAELYVDGGKYEWLCCGQSNGTVDNCYLHVKNAQVHYLNTNNRGYYGSGRTILDNTTVVKHYVLGDLEDGVTADVLGKVKLEINKGCKVNEFYVGSVLGVPVTSAEVANKYVEYVKISRDADVTYANNSNNILVDVLAIK